MRSLRVIQLVVYNIENWGSIIFTYEILENYGLAIDQRGIWCISKLKEALL